MDLRGFLREKMETRESAFFHDFFCVDAWLYGTGGRRTEKTFCTFLIFLSLSFFSSLFLRSQFGFVYVCIFIFLK